MPDAVIDIRRTIAAGNDGNQIKVTASKGRIENSVIISNCGFFDEYPYWNSDDNCRAGGDALSLDLQPFGQFDIINSTITGEGVCLMIAECALDQTCNGSEQIRVTNTLFQGQKSFFEPQEDACFAWFDDESDTPMPENPFRVDYSLITGVRFGNVSPCPGAHNLCDVQSGMVDPSLTYFDAHLLPDSLAIDAGAPQGAPQDDFEGRQRDELPDIGAYEWFSHTLWFFRLIKS